MCKNLGDRDYPNQGAGVWVGAHVDPLVVFEDVVSELGYG